MCTLTQTFKLYF